ncbi:MAG: sugar ABC transporter substrate-binding protein [Actinobacteria bacterium]|nr:sugar ABC transporter substrate-binding protein [Actinomycetota bacterium]
MTLAACGSSDSGDKTKAAGGAGTTASTKPLNIGVFATQANAFFAKQTETAREWAAKNGAKVTVYDPGFDPQKQFAQIQDAIAQGKLDGMVIAPLNGPSLAPLAAQAHKAGIATVAVSTPLSTDYASTDPKVPGLDGLVWEPLVNVGDILARQVAAACEGIDPCKAVYLSVSPTLPAETALYNAYEQTLKSHANITVLPQMGPTMAQRGPTVGITQDLLQAHPDVNVIASSDQALFGAEVALKKAGKSIGTGPGDVRLVGSGGTVDGVQRVADGAWASTHIALPVETMTQALTILEDAISGKLTAPKGLDPVADSKYPSVMTKEAVKQSGFRGEYNG